MARFLSAAPYKDDAMNLPVGNVDEAIPWYESTMNFKLLSQTDDPVRKAILGRDDVQIGLAENGGDPSQEGCYFEVDDVEMAFEELKGRLPNAEDFSVQMYGGGRFKVFFMIAPDGLCYMIGKPVGDKSSTT